MGVLVLLKMQDEQPPCFVLLLFEMNWNGMLQT